MRLLPLQRLLRLGAGLQVCPLRLGLGLGWRTWLQFGWLGLLLPLLLLLLPPLLLLVPFLLP